MVKAGHIAIATLLLVFLALLVTNQVSGEGPGPALGLVGAIDTPGQAFDVVVSGDYAYVADGYSGLRIINVSDPTSMQEVGYHEIPFATEAWGVGISGNHVYLTCSNLCGLRVIDVSDPTAPVEVGVINNTYSVYGVAVANGYAYIPDDLGGFRIIDANSPSAMQEIGAYDSTISVNYVDVVDNFVYVFGYKAGYPSGLFIIDVSNVSAPREIGNLTRIGGYSVAASGDYAYVAAYTSGLKVIDLSDSSKPTLISTLDTPGKSYDVAVVGDYVYLADGSSGLRIIDVSEPESPREVGVYDNITSARAVAVTDGYVYVTDAFSKNGLKVLGLDSDGDGVADVSDAFPGDPAASVDSDGDGWPDEWNTGKGEGDSTTSLHLDAFRDDPAASVDRDGDGYPGAWNSGQTRADSTTGLTLDAFPDDPHEWADTDGDGVGDNGDAFPDDPEEWTDTDGDGIGDNSDFAPRIRNGYLQAGAVLIVGAMIFAAAVLLRTRLDRVHRQRLRAEVVGLVSRARGAVASRPARKAAAGPVDEAEPEAAEPEAMVQEPVEGAELEAAELEAAVQEPVEEKEDTAVREPMEGEENAAEAEG